MAMYLEHFGLERPPFAMHPDPDFLFLSEQHSSAKAFLESSAFVNDSFVVITGSIGAGKTTLVEGFLAELPADKTIVARINQTQLSPTAFLRMLLDDLGLDGFKANKPKLLARLRKFLKHCTSEGIKVVVLVDEAQNLSAQVLEEIRMLTGYQHASCLSLVLVGQPEFLQTLESPGLRQLAQRCRLRSELYALDGGETHEYILHRLAVAGLGEKELFTSDALERVYELSGGVPRLINSLCDTALICAFADEQHIVGKEVIDAAVSELNWQPLEAAKPESATRKAAPNDAPQAEADQNNRRSATTGEQADAEPASQDYAAEKLVACFQPRLDEMHTRLAAALDDQVAPSDDQPLETGSADPLALLETLEKDLLQADALLATLAVGPDDPTTGRDSESELADLRQAVEQHKTRIEQLQRELAETRQAPADDAALVRLQESEARLSTSLADVAGERDQLARRLQDLEESEAANTDKITVLQKKVTARDNSIRTLEAEVRRKNRLIDELHDQLESLPELEHQSAELSQQIIELRAELDSRNIRIFELQEALSVSRQQLDEVRGELDSSQSSHVNLHKAVGELNARVTELTKGTAQRDDLVKSLQTECQNRKLDLRKLRAELDESIDQSRELRDSVEVGESRIYELESELAAAMETISEMSESCSQAGMEVREIEQQLSSSQQELGELQDELRSKDEELSTVQAELKEKTETIKVLQMDSEPRGDGNDTGDGANADPLLTQLRAEVETRGRRIEELETSLQTTSEKLAEATAALDKQSAIMLDLEEQLESSRMAAADLREELGAAGREFDQTSVLNDGELGSDDAAALALATEAGLLVNTNGRPTRRIPLRSERLIIGRTRDSDIQIDNEFASRHHAQIIYEKGNFVLEDLNSTNGIFVNSRRVKRRRLRNRDIISIGPDKMVFVLEQHTSH